MIPDLVLNILLFREIKGVLVPLVYHLK